MRAENPHRVLVKLIAEPRMQHNLVEATALAMDGARAGALPMFVLAIGPEGDYL